MRSLSNIHKAYSYDTSGRVLVVDVVINWISDDWSTAWTTLGPSAYYFRDFD